jgi:hypothetical protein
MKMGNGGIAPPFLPLALDGGEWSSSCLSHFTHREIDPNTNWIGGWVGLRAGLDALEKIKIFLYQELNTGHPAHCPWLYQLSLKKHGICCKHLYKIHMLG